MHAEPFSRNARHRSYSSEVQWSHIRCWFLGNVMGKADKPLLDPGPVTCYPRTLDTSTYTQGPCTETVLIMGSDQKNGCACCVSFFSKMDVNRAGRREWVQACITTAGTTVGGRCRNFLQSVFQETERKLPFHLHRPGNEADTHTSLFYRPIHRFSEHAEGRFFSVRQWIGLIQPRENIAPNETQYHESDMK